MVRTALAAQVNQLAYPALRTLPWPEDQINPPVGIVMPGRPYVNYASTLQGETGFGDVLGVPGTPLSETNFNLDILIVLAHASTMERIAQNLDGWLGLQNESGTACSVAAAVLADVTLGGVVRWCIPTTADAPGPLQWSGPEAYGSRVHFQLSAL